MNSQRAAAKQGQLPDDRKRRLESIGFFTEGSVQPHKQKKETQGRNVPESPSQACRSDEGDPRNQKRRANDKKVPSDSEEDIAFMNANLQRLGEMVDERRKREKQERKAKEGHRMEIDDQRLNEDEKTKHPKTSDAVMIEKTSDAVTIDLTTCDESQWLQWGWAEKEWETWETKASIPSHALQQTKSSTQERTPSAPVVKTVTDRPRRSVQWVDIFAREE